MPLATSVYSGGMPQEVGVGTELVVVGLVGLAVGAILLWRRQALRERGLSKPETAAPAGPLLRSLSGRSCPFCREEIHPDARKCWHCGEWLDSGMRRNPAAGGAAPPSSPKPSGDPDRPRRVHRRPTPPEAHRRAEP